MRSESLARVPAIVASGVHPLSKEPHSAPGYRHQVDVRALGRTEQQSKPRQGPDRSVLSVQPASDIPSPHRSACRSHGGSLSGRADASALLSTPEPHWPSDLAAPKENGSPPQQTREGKS